MFSYKPLHRAFVFAATLIIVCRPAPCVAEVTADDLVNVGEAAFDYFAPKSAVEVKDKIKEFWNFIKPLLNGGSGSVAADRLRVLDREFRAGRTPPDEAKVLPFFVTLSNECNATNGNCACRNKLLDTGDDTHPVILSERGSGTKWVMTLNVADPTLVTLANQGESTFKGRLLDIDGKGGGVVLSQMGSGTQWRWIRADNGLWSFRNEGTSDFKGYYLDIDGQTCAVMLSKHQGSGTYWRAR